MRLLLPMGAWIGIGVGVAVVLIIIFWAIAAHNKLVRLRVQCDEGFSTVDISLKKRFDLIPNVVNTVKGYAKHESETLMQIVELRSKATSPEAKIQADNQLSEAIRGLNLIVENYPDLKANTNFLSLQNQLANIENELSQARRYFNATVREYNVKIHSFPSSIIAGFMKLQPYAMFEVASYEERENVRVEF